MATKQKKINPTVAGNITVGDNLQALAAKKAEEEKTKLFSSLPTWNFVPYLPQYDLIQSYEYATGRLITKKSYGLFDNNSFPDIENEKVVGAMAAAVTAAFGRAYESGLLASVVTSVNSKIKSKKSLDINYYLSEPLQESIFENITMSSINVNSTEVLSAVRILCYDYFFDIRNFCSNQRKSVKDYNNTRYHQEYDYINQWTTKDWVTLGLNWANKGIGLVQLENNYKSLVATNNNIFSSIQKTETYDEFSSSICYILFGNNIETQAALNNRRENSAGGYQWYQNNKNQNNNPPPDNDNDNGNNDDVGSTNWLLIGAVGILVLIFFIKKSRK
ncbi:MAG: hypothetical protein UIQ67_02370 [Bacteroidales bacterium]|nr:hypothetical protein [Bacteroidales bacterium]